MSHQGPFEPVAVPNSPGTGFPETGHANQNPKKSFFEKNKKTLLIGGIVLLVLILVALFANREEERKGPTLARPDVNGLTVSAACEAVREAGWRVEEVRGTENHKETSDCSDTVRKVVRASYNDWDDTDLRVTLYFANDPLPEDDAAEDEEATEEETTTEAASADTSSSGYEAIYDEYAARLQNECPTLTADECAEISNEGVTKMAEYMYSASGTDGQYATYESWSRRLMGVYIAEAQL